MVCHTYLYIYVITAPLRGIITALEHSSCGNVQVRVLNAIGWKSERCGVSVCLSRSEEHVA